MWLERDPLHRPHRTHAQSDPGNATVKRTGQRVVCRRLAPEMPPMATSRSVAKAKALALLPAAEGPRRHMYFRRAKRDQRRSGERGRRRHRHLQAAGDARAAAPGPTCGASRGGAYLPAPISAPVAAGGRSIGVGVAPLRPSLRRSEKIAPNDASHGGAIAGAACATSSARSGAALSFANGVGPLLPEASPGTVT
jgi:hypothetical protein